VKGKVAGFVALAIALAVVFIRLGVWQLERLQERRALNAALKAALAEPAVPFPELQKGGGRPDRHTTVEGTPDFENEFVVTGRSNNGSPGVHIFTPIKVPGLERAVLVNRGWVYAADAASVDLSRWRENRRVFQGYTQQIPWGHTASIVKGRGIRPLLFNGVLRVMPYPFHGQYVVSRDPATDTTPVRLPEPDLGNGPHLSYAIQWFCFAAIALVGAGVVAFRAFRAQTTGATGA
jgi:surfeit locus 1 family protein